MGHGNMLQHLILSLMLWTSSYGGFVHPGLLNSQADFNRMAQKVAAKQSPWIDSYNALISNGHANPTWNPAPQAWAERGSGCNDNSIYVQNDAAAAYQQALVYKVTGNTTYANNAVRILNAWAYTLKGIGCNASSSWDFQLMAGIQGYQFANAGEMMRNYSGWNATAFANFQSWMVKVWYPVCYYPFASQVYANWDLICIAQHMSIGVLADNQTLFNDAVNYFVTWARFSSI
uniref:Alginate lyase domain-containing protein n=2 Tax=Acrobeloides nanus TaxID=290746 RepID=A0A914EHW9_9BILA